MTLSTTLAESLYTLSEQVKESSGFKTNLSTFPASRHVYLVVVVEGVEIDDESGSKNAGNCLVSVRLPVYYTPQCGCALFRLLNFRSVGNITC